ncbi:hypothetical protein [Carboxylicivirga sp. RSCT41]|uniref:hypothetical protein n=1 Tax=Carboxylicivirga agarovorans TaxID=3417570 RepID=UPI003D34D344
MKLIEFKTTNDTITMVNPDHVKELKNGFDDGDTIIYFDKNHFVGVVGSIKEIAKKLEAK